MASHVTVVTVLSVKLVPDAGLHVAWTFGVPASVAVATKIWAFVLLNTLSGQVTTGAIVSVGQKI